jgi:acyl-CoA thioesterase I
MKYKLLLFLCLFVYSSCDKEVTMTVDPVPTKIRKSKFLFLGDSYTIGQGVIEAERYPSHLQSILEDSIKSKKLNVTIESSIIAKTGWTTSNLINSINNSAIKDSTNFDLVALLIGVNNQYQNIGFDKYEPDFTKLLETSIKKANGNKNNVIIVSIPDYAFTPFGQNSNPSKISKELDLYNAKNKEIANKYNITYIDVTPISRLGVIDPSLVASDGLHPSGKQYKLWAIEMIDKALELIE